ncbi:hypothetical protein KAS50_01235, partial [bacterium]|nr:hypothetical protein [bacterium]
MMKYTYFKKILVLSIIFMLVAASEGVCGKDIVFYENRTYKNVPDGSGFTASSKFRDVIDLNGEWKYRQESSSQWKDVFIPSCYEYEGTIFFKKEFSIDSSHADGHCKIFLYGVNNKCTIKINGCLVGNHIGGYSSFSFDIPDNLVVKGNNTIELEVSSRLDFRKSIPTKPHLYGWKNYSG